MLTREQKLIIDLAYRGAHVEEILFVCLNEFYKEIEKCIKEFEKNKDDYGFNILGLVAVAINKKVKFERALLT